MLIRDHLTHSLKMQTGPKPWTRMCLSTFSITIPLIIGLLKNEMSIAMFGALFSLILFLNDHFGPLSKRIGHLFITFFFLMASQFLGGILIGKLNILYICLFLAAFLLGKIKDNGAELERMILFSILYMITIADSPTIKDHLLGPIFYSMIAFCLYLSLLIAIYFLKKESPEFIKSKRATFKTALQLNVPNYFPFIYAFSATFSFYISKLLHLERAYWVAGTVLIVMLPDQYSSYVKSFQRFFGTILGVVIASLLISFTKTPLAIISFVAIFSFFSPLGMMKNYWLGNLFIAGLVLFFLETSSSSQSAWHLSILRTLDIGLGCFIGVVAAFIFLKKKKAQHKTGPI